MSTRDKPGADRPTGIRLRGVAKSSVIYSLSDIVLKVFGFFLVPVYTRMLTVGEYGIVGFTGALSQVLSPALGLGLIGTIPVLYYAYSEQDRKRLISSVVNFTFLYSLAVTLILVLFGGPVFGRVSGEVAFSPYIVLALWGLFFTTFYFLPLGLFNIEARPFAYAAYAVSLGLTNIIMNLLFVVVLKMGVVGTLTAGVVSGAIGMVVAFFSIRRYYLFAIDLGKLRAVLLLALPALPHAFSGTLLRVADRFFLTGISGLADTGIYSLAFTLSTVASILLGGAITALNPFFFRRANEQDPDLPVTWARLSSLMLLGGAVIGLGMALVGTELIHLMAPPQYYRATAIMPVLILGQVLTVLYWMLSPLIGYTRKMWVYPVTSFPAMGVTLLLNALLVPVYGAAGAAWAVVGTSLVQLGIFGYFSQRYYPVPFEVGNLLKVIVVSLGLYAASRLMVLDSLWLNLAYKSVLFTLLPLLLAAWRFFRPEEVAFALESVRRIGRWIAR